jgi:hypothetical protein
MMEDFNLIFPEKGDEDFGDRLMGLKEFQAYLTQPLAPISSAAEFEEHVQQSCGGFEKTIYQHLMQHFLSRRSPYKSLLLYHFLGVGKSCSAITIAEALLLDHTEQEPPRIIVVSPATLQKNFEEELFSTVKFLDGKSLKSQCTGDLYKKLVYGVKASGKTTDTELKKSVIDRVHKLIKSRYMFVTYGGLSELASKNKLTDKVIIIDEAHNLRQDEKSKESAEALKTILKNGQRNRLILLSATPMYNEPDEIFGMLSLLLYNDGRIDLAKEVEKMHLFKDNVLVDKSAKKLRSLSTEYISYIKGNNPFTFPARLQPKHELPKLDTHLEKNKWANVLRDKIVTTVPGNMQSFKVSDADSNISNTDDETEIVAQDISKYGSGTQIQLSNITYSGGLSGKKGLQGMMSFVDDTKPVQLVYRPKHLNALQPTDANLGQIAAKIKRLCDIIKTSEGIVVIYSQFVWSGIVPCAVALEHMGFDRHDARNMLKVDKDVNVSRFSGTGIDKPSYAIFTGNDQLMGTTKIENILPILNSTENIHGKLIKVVLMTPIAGEGLSFKNAREMHILEPWYHMNRIEQVIGRIIRTCSHIVLPQEERNVTVYLHACVKDQETPDIHAYKISARKLHETRIAEKLIRDNAIDCALLKNVNSYPRDTFKFSVAMRTSQGQIVTHKYGDATDDEVPKCTHELNTVVPDARSMRPSIFEGLISTLLLRLEKHLKSHITNKDEITQFYFPVEDLVQVLRKVTLEDNVIYAALNRALDPYVLIDGYRILPHMNGLLVVHVPKPIDVYRVKLPHTIKQNEQVETQCENILEQIVNKVANKTTDPYQGMYIAYTVIDSICWHSFGKALVEKSGLTADEERVATYFFTTGALIAATEMPRLTGKNRKYIGYVDIFDTRGFKVMLYDASRWREASELETTSIKNQRVHIKKPSNPTSLVGIMEPTNVKKDPSQPYRNQLKLLGTGPKGAITKGAVCTTKTSETLKTYLTELNVESAKNNTKDQLCFTLALELLKNDRLFMYPEYKSLKKK